MAFVVRVAGAFLLCTVVHFAQGARAGEPKGKKEDAAFITLEELDKLPEGLKVVHEPKVARATLTGKSDRRMKYTWWYKTTVSATATDVTIVQFGAYVWDDRKWVALTITGKPFTPADFADWYSCPKAVVKAGATYTDPRNWTTAEELGAFKTRWYFVGIDAKGRRVKGEALVETLAEMDPKKPKDDDKESP